MIKAGTTYREDQFAAYRRALIAETEPNPHWVMTQIVENAKIAAKQDQTKDKEKQKAELERLRTEKAKALEEQRSVEAQRSKESFLLSHPLPKPAKSA